MTAFPFPTDPVLMAVSMGYRNKRHIADEVLPRVKVGKMEYRYRKYDLAQGFTVPDTKVGRRSAPNEVVFDATETPGITKDYALDDPVPQVDIDNAAKGHSPVDQAVVTMTKLIMLDREIRVANLVFDPNTYPAGNKVQLAGTDQFSDFDASDPMGVIATGIDKPIIRPNVMVIGREAFSVVARHPDIVKAVHGNAGDSGFAKREQLAELWELDKVVVGEAFVNTAKKGQAVTMARVWGKHIALLWLDPDVSNTQGDATFGFSPQYGERLAGAERDGKIGMRGGQRVRVGESIDEVVSAADLGYFIEDAVA